MDMERPIQMLPGIGPARAARLQKLGLETADDLLRWFPRQYEDRRTVYPVEGAPVGEKCCVAAVVVEAPRTTRITKGREVTRLRAADDSGMLYLTFFGQSYVRTALQVGQSYVFYGTVEGTQRRKGMTNPVFEPEQRRQDTGRIMPIYPLTAGISNHLLASAVAWCLEQPWAEWPEDLPQTIRQRYRLATRTYAVRIAHFPPSWEELAVARRRLVFEELFYFSIGLALLRQRRTAEVGIRCANGDLRGFYALLPFQLTGAQRRAAEDAARDLTRGVPMNRLLQGDVGSGKTVVGAACVWLMAQNGYQSALMAPTEILAQQHAQTLQTLLAPSGIRVGLLTGSLRAAEKRKVYDAMSTGAVDLVVGTHALLTDGVTFANLGLVITDEQHRFGVNQRAALAQKGGAVRPHMLVMSATPIPRTLALLLYGDLEVSIIDERPPGRQNVDTFLVGEALRQRMYGFVRKQVQEGHQVYMVCPAVEEGQEGGQDLKAVTTYAQTLQTKIFPDLRVGLLHGKMKGKDKEAVMAAFAAGEIDILCATTVIEVGVDVPRATLMVIENAERFGLSQLHQLRGRVGRGDAKSYCVLVSSHQGKETRQRLKALCATNDGFQIAEEDLKLRGPGDFFGQRQHGLPQLQLADLVEDVQVLQEAKEGAEWLLNDDPGLQKPENRGILDHVRVQFEDNENRLN